MGGAGRQHPVLGPLLWDKWSLFLPSHAFWLMLNPFWPHYPNCSPCYKNNRCFCTNVGTPECDGREIGDRGVHFLKVDLWLVFTPPPTPPSPSCTTDRSRGQGCPAMQAWLHWRSIHCCGARYRRERMASLQLWVVKYSSSCFMLNGCYVPFWVCLRVGMHMSWVHSLSMCCISGGRIWTRQTYLNN